MHLYFNQTNKLNQKKIQQPVQMLKEHKKILEDKKINPINGLE